MYFKNVTSNFGVIHWKDDTWKASADENGPSHKGTSVNRSYWLLTCKVAAFFHSPEDWALAQAHRHAEERQVGPRLMISFSSCCSSNTEACAEPTRKQQKDWWVTAEWTNLMQFTVKRCCSVWMFFSIFCISLLKMKHVLRCRSKAFVGLIFLCATASVNPSVCRQRGQAGSLRKCWTSLSLEDDLDVLSPVTVL